MTNSTERLVAAGVSVAVIVRDGGVRVEVAGELDAMNADAFAAAVVMHCEPARCRVVIDAAGLDFIDSAGLRAFVRILGHVRGCGGDIAVRDPNPSVRRVLDITGFPTLPGATVSGD